MRELLLKFHTLYGGGIEDVRVFSSSGRVNLIGEHTDYNGGVVFPAALSMKSSVAVRKRKDNKIRIAATDLEGVFEIDINKLENYKNLKYGNYQAGVAHIMQQAGYYIAAADMLFEDTVPHGAGLSSSAAIEVATALLFATFSNEKNGITRPVDMIEMARLAQRAENEYIGVKCGIMDQFASAMGKKDNAIFLDCKTLNYRLVPLNLKNLKIVIVNTNKKRSLQDSKYNERRGQCEEAVKILSGFIPGITCLADVSPLQFEEFKQNIKDPVILMRASHVIYEIDRVYKAVEALNNNDIDTFGVLMNQSHDSLRNLYEVTGRELDILVEEARKIKGTKGARMTGAGFGGCTVNIIEDDYIDEFIAAAGKNYTEKTGLKADFYISEAADGGMEIKL